MTLCSWSSYPSQSKLKFFFKDGTCQHVLCLKSCRFSTVWFQAFINENVLCSALTRVPGGPSESKWILFTQVKGLCGKYPKIQNSYYYAVNRRTVLLFGSSSNSSLRLWPCMFLFPIVRHCFSKWS